MMMRIVAVIVLSGSVASAAPDLVTPAPEVVKTDVKLDLPPLPSFDLPAGPLTAKRLRVAGKPLLGTRVVLHGYVTYAYDCVKAIRRPGESERVVQARIDADPTLCERPKFFIGDDKTTPRDRSLWIVDVPRPYNKLELQNLDKANRDRPDRCEPGEKDPAKQICPPYKVGDEVIIDGTFDLTSLHFEHNSDGLVSYSAMKNITRKWQTPGAKLDATMVAVSAAPAAPPKAPVIARPAPKPLDPGKLAESIKHANAGNNALSHAQLDAARDEYRAALAAWDANHLAWYGLGAATARAAKWPEAADAFEHAVALAPDVAMYRMWLGIAHYQSKHADAARAQLAEAVKLEPGLWRAHYYLGRIAREEDRTRDAAESFSRAIVANPREGAPYIALGELYRHWDYTDQAAQVLSQAVLAVPSDTSPIWFALGMAYFDKQMFPKAIDAFAKALEVDRANHRALFQRGLTYFQLGDLVHAKADLEEFVKADPKMAFEHAVAGDILMEIANRTKK